VSGVRAKVSERSWKPRKIAVIAAQTWCAILGLNQLMRGRVSFSIPYSQYAAIPRGARLWPTANPLDLEIALAMAAPLEAPETRLHALFAVLGTDLGTEPSELDANKRDVMKQAGRLNAVDLDI
jgi:hypothetical protein